MTVVDGTAPPVCSARLEAYVACTPADRVDAIGQLAAVMGWVQAELCALVTAADREGDWQADGATDMVAWLMGHCGLSNATARAWVRTGAALEELPALRGLLEAGAVSVDQTHAAARLLTPATDATLAAELPGWSVAQIERRAAQRQRLDGAAQDRLRTRRFSWR